MVTSGVQAVLQNLKKEKARIDAAITTLEALVAGAAGAGRAPAARKPAGKKPAKKKRGRPRKKAAVAKKKTARKAGRKAAKKTKKKQARKAARKAAGKTGRKNAPRGLLEKMIREALKGLKKPMSPVDLTESVMDAGYPLKNKKTLYASIFNKAKADPKVGKNKAGFFLK